MEPVIGTPSWAQNELPSLGVTVDGYREFEVHADFASSDIYFLLKFELWND